MEAPTEWLLSGEPFVEYRTRLDLLGQSADEPAVRSAHANMLAGPQVRRLVDDLAAWPGETIAGHKSAGLLLHKLTFVADLGLRVGDDGVDRVIARIMEHQSAQGPFQVRMNIAPRYGGSGVDTWAWALCDAPLVVYALVAMGLADHSTVRAAVAHLRGLVRENGWPCAVSEEMGTFRGPGRRDDPCPFASLAMLKALAQFDDLRDCPETRIGAEALLSLWSASRERHPYMFYTGTDFRKLKAPLVWYDILHVCDVLSRFPWLRGDERLQDMIGVLWSKMDDEGRFTPESVWTAWKDWEFGQKRAPSRWVTLLAWRIAVRAGVVEASPGLSDRDEIDFRFEG
ncbi:MAG: hypothetical protein R2826_11655 [Thermoleophilia bacterium]